MRRILTLMLSMLLFSLQLLAQTRTISGRVTDAAGNPIAGASVQVKGTSTGTVTTQDGTYSIAVPGTARTLTISAVGLATQEVNIGDQTTIAVTLQAGAQQSLQEVVVVGYSTTTRQAFTGTAKVVSGEQLANKNVSNVSQALAGEVSGVRVINPSGQPGTSATIRIRGIGSVNGNRDPLYVVDGVPFTGFVNSINPNDIATMTVLKDAAATAIYGSRGANGVIVITTRNGRGRQSFIEADGRVGTNISLLPRYDVLESPEEFIALGWEALYNQGVAVGNANPTNYANVRLFSTAGIDPRNNIWNAANGAALIDPATRMVRSDVTRKYSPEDWEDYAFQNSIRREANVRLGGGDGRTNYYTSFGYLKDEGYSINSDFRRLNGRINLSHEVKSWLTTAFNINYSNSITNNNGQEANSNSVFWFVDNMPPIYPLFMRDAAGAFIPDPIFGGNRYDYGETGRKFGSLTNAIADATLNTLRSNRNDLTGNTSITIKFTKDLSLENRLGVQYYNDNYVNRSNKFYGSSASQNGSLFQRRREMINTNLLNMLRYVKRFGEHNAEILAAHEATDWKWQQATASGFNLVDNYGLELSNAIVIDPTANSYTDRNKLESYFAQLNYDYNRTYYVSGTFRRDGSSRFLPGKRWGTFGSIGLGWVMTNEDFMRNLGPVNYLKLKASYGILGDQQGLGYYPGYSRIDIGNLNDNPSFGVPTPGNPDLTWETAKMFQAGVEFRMGTFLTGNIDYYVKNTDNLIFDRRVGPSSGFALIQVNDGQLRNQGLEFDFTFHILKKQNYFLDFGINGEHFTNKITAMPLDPSTGTNKVIDVQGNYAWSKGHSIFDYYLRNFAGVDAADGRTMWTVYYNDANSDGAFTSGEQVLNLEQYYNDNPDKRGNLSVGTTKTYSQATQYYSGKSAIPKLRGGFNLSGGWKGFDLSATMLYSFGGYAYDGAYAGLMANGLIGGNNWHTDIRNRWQKAGDVTDVPRLSNNQDANVASASTRFLTKANYFALNNVRLGYTLPSSWLQKTGVIESATFFVSGDNLWLHSERKGLNPSTAETGSSDTYRYSPLSTITFGVRARF
ncbi:MAG: SusC/RagA family TonB-linked outer membrane protein [Sphingobacteriales bacterium]|nr:MAG: SusC/RagA family TonB-linked outer membrane protein [Sphingobacteriales bacterium]